MPKLARYDKDFQFWTELTQRMISVILIMSIIMVDRFDHISPGLSSNAAVEHSVGQCSGSQQLQNAAAVAADTAAAVWCELGSHRWRLGSDRWPWDSSPARLDSPLAGPDIRCSSLRAAGHVDPGYQGSSLAGAGLGGEDSSLAERRLGSSEAGRLTEFSQFLPIYSGTPGIRDFKWRDVLQFSLCSIPTWTGPIDNMSKTEARADPNPDKGKIVTLWMMYFCFTKTREVSWDDQMYTEYTDI